MAYCYVVSFVHPDTGTRLRYYGAADREWSPFSCASARVRELAEWFGDDRFHFERRREFKSLEDAEGFARRLSARAHLHLRPEWLNGQDFGAPALTGDHGDRRGSRNPMSGKRHRASSRKAMAEAKRGRVWVHRGTEARQVRPEVRKALEGEGWRPGRPPKKG